MVTNNSWNSEDPAQVAKGGTGAASLTDNAVLVGSGTDAVTPLAVANEGELLVGASSADPAFGTSADGDFTFTETTAAATRTLTVENTDNTSGTSNAKVLVKTGGASGGDPSLDLQVDSQTYSFGIDNSSTDELVITDGAGPSAGTKLVTISKDGEVQMPKQPSFLAILSTVTNNVTGDGTLFTIIADSVSFDKGNNYDNTTGDFTAPITGNYEFGARATVRFTKASGSDAFSLSLRPTAGPVDLNKINPQGVEAGDQFMTFDCTTFITMTAGDTVSCAIQASNGTKTVQIVGAGVDLTAFWGRLIL